MKIIGIKFISRSKIRIEFEAKKSIVISGEMMVTPEFEAYSSSINVWEPPYEMQEISENEKNEIMYDITTYAQEKGVKIYFVE